MSAEIAAGDFGQIA